MDAVLGVATTRTTVAFVLVDGIRGDGATVDRGVFRVHTAGGVTAFCANEQVDAYEQMANRVWLQMRTIAATYRVRSVGVTWSHDAEQEALQLRNSLTDAGLGNIVAVGPPDVGYSLATAGGYEKTTVFVVEPDAAIAFAVDHAGRLNMNRNVRNSDDDLVRWLTETFDGDHWDAEGLIVAGTDGDRDAITSRLKQTLPVPVFTAAQAQSALALGAARASAQGSPIADFEPAQKPNEHGLRRSAKRARPRIRATLVAGVLGVLVLLSLGVGPPLASNKPPAPADHPQVANTVGGLPAVQPPAPAVATPVQQFQAPSADTPLAPAPAATPTVAVDVSPPAARVDVSPPAAGVDVSPPARSVPAPPATLPTAAPNAPVSPQPVAPPPPQGNQVNPVPPTVSDSLPNGGPPPRPNCFLLCGTAI